jgi:hypothetical protein
VRLGDPTGVAHRCGGQVCYNGDYFCDRCGKSVKMTPQMYHGLFVRRYPDGNYEDHPNFDRRLFERGRPR